MKAKKVDDALDQMQNAMQKLYKIVDKLEQRIASLEKVLASHAKCIGEMRGEEIQLNQEHRKKIVKRMGELHDCR